MRICDIKPGMLFQFSCSRKFSVHFVIGINFNKDSIVIERLVMNDYHLAPIFESTNWNALQTAYDGWTLLT